VCCLFLEVDHRIFFRGACHLFTIAPPRRSRRMQGLSPEHLDVSQPLPTSTPEASPHQSEVPVVTPPVHTVTPEE
jgi:hypothetical protein